MDWAFDFGAVDPALMDIARGYRIMHKGTTIPLDASCQDLFVAMAQASHQRARVLLMDSDDRVVADWDDVRPDTQQFLIDCARHSFIALVVRCGADVQEIPELESNA